MAGSDGGLWRSIFQHVHARFGGLTPAPQASLPRLRLAMAKPENSYDDARRHCLVGMMPCSFATHLKTARQERWQEG